MREELFKFRSALGHWEFIIMLEDDEGIHLYLWGIEKKKWKMVEGVQFYALRQ